ncbi:hypothetical protein NPIL_301521 [Nephila pilipes]|uniref:Uncharacterized protein n=1 Tax=Nephila pilipes TaxID=299642 RepID=A0A8X6PPK6_NEPPI|nr:hypothetical protein NPIL_301521 [Nephila pilipes]
MSQRRHLTDSEAWSIVGCFEGGQAWAEVEEATGVAQSLISRIWNRFWKTRSAEYHVCGSCINHLNKSPAA